MKIHQDLAVLALLSIVCVGVVSAAQGGISTSVKTAPGVQKSWRTLLKAKKRSSVVPAPKAPVVIPAPTNDSQTMQQQNTTATTEFRAQRKALYEAYEVTRLADIEKYLLTPAQQEQKKNGTLVLPAPKTTNLTIPPIATQQERDAKLLALADAAGLKPFVPSRIVRAPIPGGTSYSYCVTPSSCIDLAQKPETAALWKTYSDSITKLEQSRQKPLREKYAAILLPTNKEFVKISEDYRALSDVDKNGTVGAAIIQRKRELLAIVSKTEVDSYMERDMMKLVTIPQQQKVLWDAFEKGIAAYVK